MYHNTKNDRDNDDYSFLLKCLAALTAASLVAIGIAAAVAAKSSATVGTAIAAKTLIGASAGAAVASAPFLLPVLGSFIAVAGICFLGIYLCSRCGCSSSRSEYIVGNQWQGANYPNHTPPYSSNRNTFHTHSRTHTVPVHQRNEHHGGHTHGHGGPVPFGVGPFG